MSRRARRRRAGTILASFAAAALVLLTARTSRAEQFILFDATFTYTWENATTSSPSKSHYYVNEGNWLNKARPANWLTPVNYRDGTVHVRVEVLEKPAGTQQAGWALCYVANVGDYGCPYTPYYMGLGVYERDVDMHSFFNNDTIMWDRGVKQVDCVYTINGSGSGHITNFPELKDLVTPTRVRLTMVQVSQGAKYDPSIISGGAAVDAGTGDGGATKDAGAALDGAAASDRATDGAGAAGMAGSSGSPGAAGATGSSGAAGTGDPGAAGTGAAGTDGPSPAGAGGAGGMSAAGAAGVSGQGTGSGAAGTTASPAPRSGGGGCSLSDGADAPGLGYMLVTALSAFWMRRRRASTARR